MPKLEQDSNGVVTTPGRFQGRHIDEVMDYLEGLEQAVSSRSPDRVVEEEKPADPSKKLEIASANRVSPLEQMTLQRFEQDDESAFSRTVEDYDKYKEKINEIKKGLHPMQRAMKDLHRTLYVQVKTQDPEVAKRIFAKVEVAAPVETEEEAKVEVDRVAAEEAAKKAVRGPKPAPPMASPTPASRPAPSAAAKDRKPKLIPTTKIESFCRATRKNVEEYLIQLEDQGVSQDQLDSGGQLGRREQPRSVYDRTFAKRS